MANEIKIILGGDAGQLVRASQEASTALSGLQTAVVQTAKSVGQMGPSMDRASGGVERLKNGLRDVASGQGIGLGQTFQSALRPIGELEGEIRKLEQAIRQTTNPAKLKAFGDEIINLNRQINNLKVAGFETSLSKLSPSATGAAAGIHKLSSAAGAGNGVLLGFNRIIQDIPFGFVGIQNNITELPNLFRSLSLAAKESGQSIGKVLLGALVGAGGIGTALSLVTSALTFATVGFSAWTRGMSGSGKAAKAAKSDVDEYNESVKSITKTVADEVAKASVLVDFIGRETTSRKERTDAIKELQSIAPQYFANLNAEKATVEQISQAYAAFTNNIQNSIKARIFGEQLKKVIEERLKLEESINKKGEEQVIINGKLVTARNFDLRTTQEKRAEQGRYNQLLLTEQQLTAKINELQKPELRTGKDDDRRSEDKILKSLRQELEGYQKQLEVTNKLREAGLLPLFRENDAFQLQLQILKTLGAIDAREVVIKTKPKLEIDPVLGELEIQKAFREFGERAGRSLEVPLFIRPKIKLDVSEATGSNIISPQDFDPIFKALQRAATQRREDDEIIFLGMTRPEILKQIKDLQQSLQDAIPKLKIDLKVEALTSLGEAIGNIFSGQGADGLISAAQAFLGTIGSMLSQVGQQIIATSVLIQALKKALATIFTNPAATLGIGVALVAAGALIKNIKFNVPKFASGGIATGPTLGIFGEAGKEAIIPLDRLPEMLGNLNSAQTPVLLQPSIRFSGMDFQIMLERVTTKRGRLG